MKKTLVMILSLMATPLWALSFDGAWSEQKFPLKNANRYGLNGASLSIQSQDAVSLLYRPLYQNATQASWSWQVSQSVPTTDLSKKGGDDRNLSLYFVFMPEAEAEASRGQALTKILRNPNAKALIYTYGGSAGRGASFQSPYTQGRGLVIVKSPAGAGSGAENVDLAADFQRAYGAAPGVLIGVAVSADSDDTDSTINATISNLNIN